MKTPSSGHRVPALSIRNLPGIRAVGYALLASTGALGFGQTVGKPAESASANEPPPIVLTPFEVQTNRDVGYLAQNTTAGSRLNASLKDTPASVSVFTAEFLQDIGATNLEELSRYFMNTDVETGFSRDAPLGNNYAESDATFRIRGLSVGSGRLVNFFPRSLEVDTFNTERVEFSRGPNAVLFGIGLPGGAMNVQTKRARLGRSESAVSLRVGSYDRIRFTGDFNFPVVKDRLAIRLNLAQDDVKGWRPHEFKDAQRVDISSRLKVGPRTILDMEFEGLRVKQSAHRPYVGFDAITKWRALGSQLDPQAGTPIPANAGIRNVSTVPWFTFDSGSGQLWNMRNQSQSESSGDNAIRNRPMLTDFSLVPKGATLGGSALGSDVDGRIYSAFLQHELVDRLFLELAYNGQNNAYLSRDVDANAFWVVYDTNVQLPNRTANPNVGRPYIETNWAQKYRYEDTHDFRLTGSYEIDLGKRFGTHRMAGLTEHARNRGQRSATIEVLTQNAPNAIPENNQNRVYRRTYVGLDGPTANVALADYRSQPIVGVINQNEGLPITTAFVPNQNVDDDRSNVTAYMGVLQSRFLGDRLVSTVGYRKDSVRSHNSVPERGPDGLWRPVPNREHDSQGGVTRTLGAVWHASAWVSSFYNRSSSFQIPGAAVLFPGDNLPPPRGEGRDMGLKFSFLGDRLFATVTNYTTHSRRDSLALNAQTVVTPLNNIWTTLDTAGVLSASGVSLDDRLVDGTAVLMDSDSKGWEGELVANPVSGWRLSLSASINETVNSNVGMEVRDYIDRYRGDFLQGNRGRMVIGTGALAANAVDSADGQTTIAETLINATTIIEDEYVRPEGTFQLGSAKYMANLRSNYSFQGGRLRGVSFGVGTRWRAAPTIGYTSSDPARRQPIEGAESLLFDMNIGYRSVFRVAGRRLDFSLQLNVDNLLNRDDIVVTRSYNDGSIRTYRFEAPRSWGLTTALRF